MTKLLPSYFSMVTLILALGPFLAYGEAYDVSAEADKPMLVVVSRDGCIFCDLLENEIKKLKDGGQLEGLVLAKVNVTREPRYRGLFGERAYPTTFLYGPDKRLRKRIVGKLSRLEILNLIGN